MRRHAKASSAGSTSGQASRLGSFFRGALASRAASPRAKGTGAPSAPRPRRRAATLLTSTLGALLAAMAFASAPALAEGVTGFEAPSPFGEFNAPRGAAVDNGSGASSGDVYIADAENHRVVKFNPSGTEQLAELKYTPTPAEEAEGKQPLGVVFWDAVDPATGNVYATNNKNEGAVTEFSPTGTFISQIIQATVEAAPLHAGFHPSGVAFDGAGRLYVADQTNQVIDRLSATGEYETQFPDEVSIAVSIAVDTSGGPNNGNVYVTDFFTAVKAFSAAGTPVTPAGCASNVIDTNEPLGVAVDPLDGAVLVSEGGSSLGAHLVRYQNPCEATPISFGEGHFNEGSDGIAVSAVAPHKHDVYAVSNSGTIANLFPAEVEASGPPLTIVTSGEGTVTSIPHGINCGVTCTHEYEEGKEVELTATPATHFKFAGWSTIAGPPGTCTGATSPCEVTMSEAIELEAEFTEIPQQTLEIAVEGLGEVTSSPPGISCIEGGGTCSEHFDSEGPGSIVTLTATPTSERFTFAGWSEIEGNPGTCVGAASPCEVTMSEAVKLEAKFSEIEQETLTVENTGTGTGEVSGISPGPEFTPIECGLTCSAEYNKEVTITLAATPIGHSEFEGWSTIEGNPGTCVGAASPCEVTMSEAVKLGAIFTAIPQQILEIEVEGSGEVSSSPPGISCTSGVCAEEFEAGSTVELTATPAAHNNFEGWSTIEGNPGTCVGAASPCEVTMSEAIKLKAKYVPIERTLTVTVVGTGEVNGPGTISGCTSAGGPNCTGTYNENDVVPLTDTPGAHFKFSAWSGADHGSCTTAALCEVTIPEHNAAITATNVQLTHTLKVTRVGEGEVKSEPAGIACGTGSGCEHSFNEPQMVKLTATPAAHNHFVKWSGTGVGSCTTATLCEVEMTANKAITAEFAQTVRTLTVTKAGTGTGSVTCNGGACASTYNDGTAITLAATAASGSTFAGFSGGGCSGTGPCKVTIEANTAVTATFNTNPPPPPPPPPAEEKCVVPKLAKKSLGQAKSALKAAHCALGKVTKPKKSKGALVVKSSKPGAGTTLPAGSKVALKLGPKPKKKH